MKIKLGNIREKVLKLPTKYDKLSPMEKAEIRDMYVELQEGKCWYCKGNLKKGPTRKALRYKVKGYMEFPKTFFHHRIHLHHDHVTGLTIGATHAHCNAVLAIYYGE